MLYLQVMACFVSSAPLSKHLSPPKAGAVQVQVLRGVTLDIEPGQVVALVGSSGSGKSSILKLIERLYQPSKGQLLLDGQDLGEYDDSWLKRHIAFVGQEVRVWPAVHATLVTRRSSGSNIFQAQSAKSGAGCCATACCASSAFPRMCGSIFGGVTDACP